MGAVQGRFRWVHGWSPGVGTEHADLGRPLSNLLEFHFQTGNIVAGKVDIRIQFQGHAVEADGLALEPQFPEVGADIGIIDSRAGINLDSPFKGGNSVLVPLEAIAAEAPEVVELLQFVVVLFGQGELLQGFREGLKVFQARSNMDVDAGDLAGAGCWLRASRKAPAPQPARLAAPGCEPDKSSNHNRAQTGGEVAGVGE